MTEADGIFVYGTLREGGSNHAWLNRTHPVGACRATAVGRLFHLPMEGYPAMVAAPSETRVHGEFVGYEDNSDLDSALADLDALEGVEEGLFVRQILPVRLESGQEFHAWVYLFPEDRLPRLERDAVELPGGDWSPYLAEG